MSKLRKCPYCNTVYRYRDIIGIKGKLNECYHCKKPFEVKKIYRAVPIVIICVMLIAFNLFIMNSSENISTGTFGMLIIINTSAVLFAFLISPLMTCFKGYDKKQLRKITQEKNKKKK